MNRTGFYSLRGLRGVSRVRLAPLVWLVAALGLGPAGCGYQWVRTGDLEGIDSIAVSMLRNDTNEPGVEVVVTDAIRSEFLRRGAVRLVEDPEAADMVISGRVLPMRVSGRSFSSVVLALEYEITLELELDIAARDPDALEPGYEIDRASVIESEIYLASADREAQRKNQQEAVRKLASTLAVRVHETLYEQFRP